VFRPAQEIAAACWKKRKCHGREALAEEAKTGKLTSSQKKKEGKEDARRSTQRRRLEFRSSHEYKELGGGGEETDFICRTNMRLTKEGWINLQVHREKRDQEKSAEIRN